MHITQAGAPSAATEASDEDMPVDSDGPEEPAGDAAEDDPDTADAAISVDDLFAAFEDEVPDTGEAARVEYLSIRPFTPMRHVLVQHIKGAPERPSTLGTLVAARQPRALLLYLLILACEHRLSRDRRLPVLTIARMLTTANYPCTSAQARRAIEVLAEHKLVRVRWTGTSVEIVPLLEDGSGEDWYQPTGDDEDPDLQRYFTLPNTFFDDAVLDKLKLPGIAILLVALKETSKDPVFSISVERYAKWYGISERTAERGYRELLDAELMYAHRQLKKDSKMARGLKATYHRTLLGAFSTKARRDAQTLAKASLAAAAAKQVSVQVSVQDKAGAP